jgi:hypothetical protein
MLSPCAILGVATLLVTIAVAQYADENYQVDLFSPSAYEAPLLGSNDPNRVLGSYYVKLTENHFEKHIAQIGTQRHVQFRLPGRLHDSYAASEVEDGLLAAIRADPGVQLVECDHTRSYEDVRDKPIPNPE